MKYLAFTLIILIGTTLGGVTVEAVAGEEVRWDWVLGQPTVTDDPTNACSNETIARASWVLGQPAMVFDATATCGAVAAPTPDPSSAQWQQRGNSFIRGNVYIK